MTLIINTLIFIFSFVGVLSFLIFFHELGHYSVARFFNVAVERFSIGFGKPIWRRTAKSGTEWTISRIPLGGYVRFLGDKGAASNPDTEHLEEIKAELEDNSAAKVEDCFHFKPLWQRSLIVLAGPIANFILAAILFACLAIGQTRTQVESVVNTVIADSPAADAGVQEGDKFLTMNGKDVSNVNSLSQYVSLHANEEIETEIRRNGNAQTLTLIPRREVVQDAIGGDNRIGRIGVRLGGDDFVTTRKITVGQAPLEGIKQVGTTLALTGTYLGRILRGKEDGKALGGVVRIGAMTGKLAIDSKNAGQTVGQKFHYVFRNLLTLAAALSIGLGVANLMPIPALDGGHLLFYGYEALAGRPLSEKKQEVGFAIGFALILSAFVYLTWNDIGYVGSLIENAGD